MWLARIGKATRKLEIKRAEEERQDKKTAERERINREALFADFKNRKEWETAFNVNNAQKIGAAKAIEEQATYEGTAAKREQQAAAKVRERGNIINNNARVKTRAINTMLPRLSFSSAVIL